MKKLLFESSHTPDVNGYPDRYVLISDDDTVNLEHGDASCCPNPFRPSDRTPWQKAYGWLACGGYVGVFTADPMCQMVQRVGPCILLNGGGVLPARFPNVNHDNTDQVSQVFVHKGEDGWRGSAGCLTLPPMEWTKVISHLTPNEEIRIIVVDYSGMVQPTVTVSPV